MDFLKYTVEDLLADETFLNYLNKSNPEDVYKWESILVDYPLLKERVSEAAFLHSMLVAQGKPDKERDLQKLMQVIEHKEMVESEIHEDTTLSDYKFFKRRLVLMVAVLTAILVAILWWDGNNMPREVAAYSSSYDSYMLMAETKLGERKEINLPDGSTVVLNGSSVLSIHRDFNKQQRIVKIIGEGFFEVAKNKAKPFMVVAGNTVTTALGTSFKVNSSKKDEISVMLATGKVSVKEIKESKINQEEILEPGEQVKVYSYRNLNKSQFDINEITNWKTRNIKFSSANLNEIKDKLLEVYGISIVALNEPRKSLAFTGEMHDMDVNEVLDIIGTINRFTYETKNDKVYITFKNKTN